VQPRFIELTIHCPGKPPESELDGGEDSEGGSVGMKAGSGDIYSLADVLGHFSALRMSGGITRLSLAHLVDWRTTVVSLIARTRLSELRGLAFVVGICCRAKRRTRAGGAADGRTAQAL